MLTKGLLESVFISYDLKDAADLMEITRKI
jgi:hypothetical protein